MAVAACLFRARDLPAARTRVAVLSGGNVDPALLADIMSGCGHSVIWCSVMRATFAYTTARILLFVAPPACSTWSVPAGCCCSGWPCW